MLQGCAWLPPSWDGFRTAIGLAPAQTSVKLQTPAAWQAPLPHEGKLSSLKNWWWQFNDPLLIRLIEAAQAVSPSVASAKARIEQARSKQVSADASLLPEVNATAGASRGLESLFFPPATISAIGLETRWELDLFGANQAARAAAQARTEGATAAWHDARVLVAAEVANQYHSFRSCSAQMTIVKAETSSRAESARLSATMQNAGLETAANTAIAQSSAAQANNTLLNHTARCELAIKALVALTGEAEADLRQRLQIKNGQWAPTLNMSITAVPGEALAQRPDIIAAAQEVIAASADISQLQAQRYPKISFSGKISMMHMELAPAPRGGMVWSVGPLSVTLPVFDGGLRNANVAAAKARYQEAQLAFLGKLRNAVREVEDALVNLHSIGQRKNEIAKVLDGFQVAFSAQEELYHVGMLSLLQLEDARRAVLQAQNSQIEWQREQIAAWITLYRALGGGWRAATTENADTQRNQALFN